MATRGLENLFDAVGSLLSPEEIQDIVQGTKNYLQSPIYSKIENNDFRSLGKRLQKHGRLSANNLGILENYVAPKASRREEIEKAISQFKTIAPEEYISEVFVGRESEMEKINERLQNPRVKALSLFGPHGVGKTTLAFEAAKSFYTSGDGKAFDFVSVDLKGSERGTQSLNFHVLQAFGVQTIAYELEMIRKHVNTLKTRKLVLLDNVEQFLIRTEGETHDENFIKLVETMMQSENIKMILTSRAKIDEPSLRKFGLSEFEVKPLPNNLAKDMITRSLGTAGESVGADTLSKVVEISRNKPLLLKGILPIVQAEIRSLEEVVNSIEENLKNKESDTSLTVDEMKDDSCFREMFQALTSEQQKDTIKLSLFRVAFSVSDAEKLLGKPSKDSTNLTLEILNQAKIVSIHDSTEKSVERTYEIHPRLLEFLRSLKKSSAHAKEFAKAEELFYKLFVEKICKLSELLETDFITACNEMEKQRPNFELTLEIATNTPFLLHLDDYHKDALIFILFEVMLNVGQRRNFYRKWSSIAKEEGKWLVAGQLKCWEAEQVISLEGPNKALGILEEARAYLDKAKPLVSKESFEVAQSLYLYVRGEILEDLGKFEDALEDLEQSLKIRRSVFGKHTLIARTMNAIGNCLQCLERYEEAHEYYYKTKEMREELTGSEKHFDMPVYCNQLATIHEVKGCKLKYSSKTKSKATLEQANKEFQTCISWYREALKLEADLGIQGYGSTATYYRNMANTFMHLEKYDEALECVSKALEIGKEIFKEHPDTVKSLYQGGIALEWKAHASNKDSKLLEEALTYYEEAKKMLQNLPEDNRGTPELHHQIEERCKVLPVTLRDYERKKWTLKREEKPLKAESDAEPHLAFLQLNDAEPLQATLQGNDAEPHQATLQGNDAEPRQAALQDMKIGDIFCSPMDDRSGYVCLFRYLGQYPFYKVKNVKRRKDVQKLCSIDAIPDQEYCEEDAILEESQSVMESKVVLLGDEWGSLKGDLSTFNRQLAVHLAKRSDLKVSCFFPEVSDSDKNAASKEKVTLIEADPIPGNRDPLVKLHHWPTKQPFPDVIISHDQKFGSPAYSINKKREYRHCKWVHFVHVNYEEMGKYKVGSNEIGANNLKYTQELSLCKNADVVVAVGPQLLDRYSKSLSIEQKKVQVFYPGLSKEFQSLPQQKYDSREFHVYIFGCCSLEDLELMGVDLVANAVGKLGKNYKLYVVGVQKNEEENTLEHISNTTEATKNQLFLREYSNDLEERKRMMCEADLVVMPSRAEAFGWIGLEALSACIPLLVSAASGLGMTLKALTSGDICVVESDDFQDWADKIDLLKEKQRSQRIEEMKRLRTQYDKKYKWEEQCSVLAKLFRDDCNDGQGKGPTN